MFRRLKLLKTLWKPSYDSVARQSQCTQETLIKNLPGYCMSKLSNGLTVASETRSGSNMNHVCIGIFVDAGSRNESRFENGIAHFFEHLIFKGSTRYNRRAADSVMHRTGGRFNTFTTREMCGYYAIVHREHLDIVANLLADGVFCNLFIHHEIEQQKEVVMRKLEHHDIDHNSLLWDYLHGAAFFGTTLGQSVVGPSSNLHNFQSSTICCYHTKFFTPVRTVFAAVGAVSHDELYSLAERYLLHMEPGQCTDNEYRFTAGDFRFRHDGMPLCNLAIAFETPGMCDSIYNQANLDVAAMYIGGWDRSQLGGNIIANLIAQACSVGFGEAYKPFYIKYHDSGLWGIQFLAKRLEIDDVLYNIQRDFMNLCTTITECEVARGKAQAKRRVLEKAESLESSCLDLAKNMLYVGKHITVQDRLEAINRVFRDTLLSTCNDLLYDRCPVVAAVGPCESLPEYNRIRAGQYWVRL